MGKKRKLNGGRPAAGDTQREEQTKYNINEGFADSEDEFFTGQDQILLEDGPSSKRQKAYEDGMQIQSFTSYVEYS